MKSNKKCNDDWGVKGYNIPKFNYHLDKPQNITFAKGKLINFLKEEENVKSKIPGPIYNIAGSMLKKTAISFIKRDRPLFTVE